MSSLFDDSSKIIFILLLWVLVFSATIIFTVDVYAAEEESVIQEDDESELSMFGYYEVVQEECFILTKIYNLLLTMFYFAILYVGSKVIKNLRKGALYGRFN